MRVSVNGRSQLVLPEHACLPLSDWLRCIVQTKVRDVSWRAAMAGFGAHEFVACAWCRLRPPDSVTELPVLLPAHAYTERA